MFSSTGKWFSQYSLLQLCFWMLQQAELPIFRRLGSREYRVGEGKPTCHLQEPGEWWGHHAFSNLSMIVGILQARSMRLLAQAYLEWNSEEHWQKALRAVSMAEEVSIKAENLSSDVIGYILLCSGIQSSVSVVLARSSSAQLFRRKRGIGARFASRFNFMTIDE